MYSIGEFSKIGSISTKTLRYYDEIGLLQPAFVDQFNHYRYYTEEQVDEILYITELKNLDLRLEQIKAVMENSDKSLLEHFLKERITQINDQMQESIRLRCCIEKKVQEIQLGGRNMSQNKELAVELKDFQPVAAMSKSALISMSEISSLIGSCYEAIFRRGIRPTGPVLTFYKDQDFNPESANVEVCVPVDHVADEAAGIRTVAPGTCAMCIYQGSYTKLGKAYAAVIKWIGENGYQISGAPFDCYLSDPKTVTDESQLVTEVWFPVAKKE